jgi:hypothetical protein
MLLLNFAQNLTLLRCSNKSFSHRDENTHLCNTATASLLLPYLLHQPTRSNHRHIITRRCLVIAHSQLDATYIQTFRELNCDTSYSWVEHVFILEYYFTLKQFTAVREAFSNA